jgi:hypothetical protein
MLRSKEAGGEHERKPMRVIVDASLLDTIAYYETFPCEPTVHPDSMFRIDLPIARDDRLDPITRRFSLGRGLMSRAT